MAVSELADEQAFDLRRQVDRARGDPEAFGVLYDLYVDRIHAFCFRRLGSRAEAEDVTAETMARALAGLPRFRWRAGGFGAWLFRIARNLCLDALKDRARSGPWPRDAAADLPDAGESPEDQALAAEARRELRAMLTALPDHQLEVVLLKYTAGLRNTEIAACTGMTPTAVSSLLYRTLQKLRERLGEHLGGPQ